jgi:NADPH-dependent glutamate synthase beta subunit-like oxidoreductase
VEKEERCCPIFHICELRKVAEFVGIPDDTPRYLPAALPIVGDEPFFIRDHNLCIGCLRCVRMCRDVRKVDALGFVLDGSGKPVVGTKAPTLKDSGCRFCLNCVGVCPTGALRLKMEDPRLDGERATRCISGCPAGMDALPRVLGEVCFHPCEEDCLRDELSEPIAICALKRAAMDHSDSRVWESRLQPHPATGKKVAVVGAGPAGLTAAWFLKLKGHEVLLLDSQPLPGGWLRNGIPTYRLSRKALDADIEDIAGLGIEFEMGVEVGKDVTLDEIRAKHDAVLIAVGARNGKKLPCAGADLPGVEMGLDLLTDLAAGGHSDARSFEGEKVVVIGGGNVAIDVARAALRLGPEEVHIYCLEKREEMPAHGWEIEEAEREGVVVHPAWGPSRIAGEGKVESVDLHKCVSVFDKEGRFRPEFDEEAATTQVADRVLVAIGQLPVLEFMEGDNGLQRSAAGYVRAEADSMQLSLDGVFAAGEIVSGPASVIDAIAQGRRAASGMDRYLGGDGEIHFPLLDQTLPDGELGQVEGFFDLRRCAVRRLPTHQAAGSFALVEEGYTSDEAVREAERCLQCDLRLGIRQVLLPPEAWIEFTEEKVASVPDFEGVYQLLDENKVVYAIKGVDNLRASLSGLLETSIKAKFFLYDEDPMYSKRESELIQEYLRKHGCMPPGEGEDELDDLFD